MNRSAVYFSNGWLIVLFIALRTLNQILFKKVALGPGGVSYFELFFDSLFYLSAAVFFLQTVVWLLVLKRFPLSFAYPFTSVTLISIMASGTLFFGESISLGNVLGGIVIIVGVAVISRDKQDKIVKNVGQY